MKNKQKSRIGEEKCLLLICWKVPMVMSIRDALDRYECMFIRNTNCLDFKVPLPIFWQPREIWHHRLSGWGFEKWERDGSDVSSRKTKNKLYQEPINMMGSWLYQYQSGKLNTGSRAQFFLRVFAFSFAVALLFLNLPDVCWYGTWVSWVSRMDLSAGKTSWVT